MKKTIFILFTIGAFCKAYTQNAPNNWFVFAPKTDYGSSRINMKYSLDAPAGKHGFLGMKEHDLIFKDGTPIKFWGVNIASNRPFVERQEADRWADFMTVYGINAVRFHKFTWDATDGLHSTALTKDKWNNLDYFSSALKNRGIYYSWSHIYGHRVMKADSSRLLAYNEVVNTRFPWAHLNGSTASIVNFAEDLQNLSIELTVNMLNHLNPFTGLRYADDPALAFIELQNEDNIFWSAIEATLKQTPTYRDLLCRKFSQWLKNKYGSAEVLESRWGKGILPQNESILNENIYPQPNHGLFTQESEKAWKEKTSLPTHITDKALFLYEQQAAFYTRFENAIRSTGYKGLIVGSCWQAGSGLAHLLNLYADFGAGVIDRHNYFGGGTGHNLDKGKVNNTSMLTKPGSGLLSTGFQQVADRPFFMSEWMSLIPNQWTAESSPLIAAYGMGLQGWDASFAFAMDYSGFTPTVQSGHGVYNVTSPTQLALYPALAAMIYRNDIKEGRVIANRKVSFSELSKGKLPFYEKVEQESDVKKLESVVPLEFMAAGRVVLSFNDNSKITVTAVDKFIDTIHKKVSSTTGQLVWDYSDKGYFTINTEGTQGVIGFTKNRKIELKDISITTTNEFAIILVTSLSKKERFSSSGNKLVTVMARARNTNMKYDEEKKQLLNVGTSPILLEPVVADISLLSSRPIAVYILDHSGNRTGETVPVKNGRCLLDGRKYKAIYYEIVNQ